MPAMRARRLVPALALVVVAAGAARAQTLPATESSMVSRSILVHITHGPEHPTRAALGFAVADAALRQGHTVSVFLAGDAVQLIRDGVLDSLSGLGTGNLRELYDGIVASGGRFYLSGGSSRARGVTEADVADKPVRMAAPDELVRLSLAHERMFTY